MQTLFGETPAPAATPATVTARPYQEDAGAAVHREWEERQSTLVVMATGLGKTVIAGMIARQSKKRFMFLAHRRELIDQAARTLHRMTGEAVGTEMGGDIVKYGERLIVSSVQSQCAGVSGRGRMSLFSPSEFDRLIIDEAHHSPAETYRRVIAYYQHAGLKIMGLTATPDRADEAALGAIFESVAYEYDLGNAITDGWLVPIRCSIIQVEGLDFSKCRGGAELNEDDIEKVVAEEEIMHRVVAPTMELLGGRRALVFGVTVKHAEGLAEIFNRYQPGCADWVCGKTPEETRKAMLSDFASGKTQILVNVGVATEGFDDPGVEVVVMARPTKSRALYAQMVGRGTRPLPGTVEAGLTPEDRQLAIFCSGKQCLEVVDFVGNSGKHKLVTATDILSGKNPDDVMDRARENLKSGKEDDPQRAIERAKEELEEEKRKEQHKRKHIRAESSWSRSTINTFDLLDVEIPTARGWDANKRLSPKQCAFLERQKVNWRELSYPAAKALLDKMFGRMQHGWATLNQMKMLRRFGYSAEELKGMRMEVAGQEIDRCKANGWKRPRSQ